MKGKTENLHVLGGFSDKSVYEFRRYEAMNNINFILDNIIQSVQFPDFVENEISIGKAKVKIINTENDIKKLRVLKRRADKKDKEELNYLNDLIEKSKENLKYLKQTLKDKELKNKEDSNILLKSGKILKKFKSEIFKNKKSISFCYNLKGYTGFYVNFSEETLDKLNNILSNIIDSFHYSEHEFLESKFFEIKKDMLAVNTYNRKLGV